jgi:hypothetical protein
MIYKVSYVVKGGVHPGAIVNENKHPEVGDIVTLGKRKFRIVEVEDIIPPRNNFAFIHVLCVPQRDE